MYCKKSAFNLMEMIVVIAIVAILAAAAVPAYQTYMDKARISRLVSLADVYWQLFVDYYEAKGTLPILSELVSGYGAAQNGNPAFILPGWTNDIDKDDVFLESNVYHVDQPYPAFHIRIFLRNIKDPRINLHSFEMTGRLENGSWIKQCGQWNADHPDLYVDPAYMPESCNETPVQILPDVF